LLKPPLGRPGWAGVARAGSRAFARYRLAHRWQHGDRKNWFGTAICVERPWRID